MRDEATDRALSRRKLLAVAALAGGASVAPVLLRSPAEAAAVPCCQPDDLVDHTAGGNTFRYAKGQVLVDLADDGPVSAYIASHYPGAVRVELTEISTVKYTDIADNVAA